MPNDNALGAGAGFFHGFNQVFTPFVMNSVEQQQRAALQSQLILKKEAMDTLASAMDHGLLDENNKDEQEALAFAFSQDSNMKAPKNLATTLAVWRSKLSGMESRIGDATDFLNSGGGQSTPQQQAQAAPAPTPTTPPPGDPTAGNMYGDVGGVPGSSGQFAPTTGAVAAETPSASQAIQPGITSFGDSDVDRAALAKAKMLKKNASITFKHKGFNVTYQGETFTEQEKRKTNHAYQQFNKGASLDESVAELGPKEAQIVRERAAGDIFSTMMEQGSTRQQAAQAAVLGARAYPRPLADWAFGSEEAAAKAIATGRAEISLIPEKRQAESGAALTSPKGPEERALAVEAGTLSPKTNKSIQRTLQGENKQKAAAPTAEERLAIAERQNQIDQLNRIEILLPKTKILGPVAGRLAGVSEEYLSGLGLSEADLTAMAEINGFRNTIIKQLSGGAVPAAEYERVQKQLPDVSLSMKVNKVRIQQTRKNLENLQRKYGDVLFQSGVTQLPEAVTAPAPAAGPTPAAAPSTPAPFKILGVGKPTVNP